MTSHTTTPPISPASSAGLRLFAGIFADARHIDLPLVPLRPRSRDPQTALSGGDYDLLVSPDSLASLILLVQQRAQRECASFTINRIHADKLQIHIHVPTSQSSILLELWSHLEVRDPARRSARCIEWSSLAPLLVADEDGPRLPPDIEVAYFLSHLATRDKQIADARVAERLTYYATLARIHAPQLAVWFEGLTQERVLSAAIAANEHLRSRGVLAGRTLPGAYRDSLAARWASMERRRRRKRVARHRVIAVTGADGVGKSTVIDRWRAALNRPFAVQRFKNLFRHHPWYQVVYRMRASSTQRRLGGVLPKNAFDEVHALTMFALARSAWPFFRLLCFLLRPRCLDRCFHDLLFIGLRGTSAEPRLCEQWQILAERMPRPEWHIHLDAPDEVIRARKQELTLPALACYRDGMQQIIVHAPTLGFSRIDTSAPLDEVMTCLRLATTALGVRMTWISR